MHMLGYSTDLPQVRGGPVPFPSCPMTRHQSRSPSSQVAPPSLGRDWDWGRPQSRDQARPGAGQVRAPGGLRHSSVLGSQGSILVAPAPVRFPDEFY